MPGDSFNATGTGLGYRTTTTANDATPSSNATGGKLWLPIWSGEVLHAYDEYNVFEGLVDHKTIASGREMLFPRTGTVDLEPQWGAGEELIGGTDSKSNQFKVSLDNRPMAAHFELDNVDLMVTQWEYRAELARQAGLTLANTRDKQIGSYIATAALQSALTGIAGSPAGYGTNVTNMGMEGARDMHDGQIYCAPELQACGADTGATWSANNAGGLAGISDGDDITAAHRTLGALKILEMIEANLVHLQTINAPMDQIYCAVSPKTFQEIRALGVARSAADAVNAQPMFGGVAQAGGLGAPFTQGLNALSDTLTYMGVIIMKSNHCPIVDYGAGDIGEGSSGAKYHKTWAAAGVKAIMWQRSAVAALSLQGLKVDTVDDVRRNTTFTVASMMNGTGVMRPELAAIFVDATSSSDADGTCTVDNVKDEACAGSFVNEYTEA
tara:strand:- start:3556 stop:4875 length:1320 start_codon:yes stop_codon:yes gene_type:complete